MSVTVLTGVVKQVLSGDSVLIRDRPIDGPPAERVIILSHISCGRIGRKPSPSVPSGVPEEPYAWLAREYVRKKVVGKEVCYVVENELPSGRSYGCVYIGKSTNGENIALSLVEQGLAEVRKLNNPMVNKSPVYQALVAAEETAKTNGTGRWLNAATGGMRHIVWSIDDPKAFLAKYQGVPIPGIIEYVKDGSSFQLTIAPEETEKELPVFYHISLSLAGITAPVIKQDEGTSTPFALEAQFFVESRLLQRDVSVILQSADRQRFIGSVLHPNGNIAEVLLREGLAKCIEWSLNAVAIPGAGEAYRAAERVAKERRIRLWKGYQPQVTPVNSTAEVQAHDPNRIEPGMSFTGQVAEVGNGDNVSVRCSDGVVRKFFLASIRFPRPIPKEGDDATQRIRIRPLYDVPYLFEARETLRAFVGKSVTVDVDYIQPKTATVLDERSCATVKCGTVNLAELVVSKGLAQVIRHRGANDARSSAYSDLLAAEEQAQSKGQGIHSKEDPPVHRVADLTGNLAKSRQFIHFLQRTPRMSAIVEFVVHGSRIRAYLPRETCIITLLLSGVQCPRRGRPKPDGTSEPDMPFCNEAYEFTKQMCHQRDVEVEIVTMDRVGNFVGYVFIETSSASEDAEQKFLVTNGGAVKQTNNKKKKKKASDANSSATTPQLPKCNLSVLLVSKGLATVSRTATTEQSPYFLELSRAEDAAKASRVGLWSSDSFVKQWEEGLSNANEAALQNGLDDDRGMGNNGAAEYLDDISILTSGQKDGSSANTDGKSVKSETALQWKVVQITAMPKPAPGSQGLRFFAQNFSDSGTIIKISELLNSTPPVLLPNFSPRKGELCCACFSLDNCWYRARVLRRTPTGVLVQFVDFGNEEAIAADDFQARLAPLPLTGSLASLPPQAHEYRLAFVQLPPDAGDRALVERAFADCVENKKTRIGVIYDSVPCANEPLKPVPAVALSAVPAASVGDAGASSSSSSAVDALDVACALLNEGLVFVEPMQPQLVKRIPAPDLLKACLEAQAVAKKERKNLWCYGDFRVDNAQA